MSAPHVASPAANNSWVDIFKHNWTLTRFLFAFVFIAASSGLIIYFIMRSLHPTFEVDPRAGTITISDWGEPNRAFLLLPASQLWFDTGITVSKNEKLHIYCSGKVHLAVHRLVETAQNPVEPPHHVWGDPDGHDLDEERPIDLSRRKMLVDPNARMGSVLAFIKSDSSPSPGIDNPKPKGIQHIGKDGSIQGEGRLYLTVNDLVFEDNQENRTAFIGNPAIVAASYNQSEQSVTGLAKEWDGLKKNHRTTAFYDDNIGDFLVQILVESK